MTTLLTVQEFSQLNGISPDMGCPLSQKAMLLMREQGLTPGEGVATRELTFVLKRGGISKRMARQKTNTYPATILHEAYANLLVAREHEAQEALALADRARERWVAARDRARSFGYAVKEATPWAPPVTPQVPLPLEDTPAQSESPEASSTEA